MSGGAPARQPLVLVRFAWDGLGWLLWVRRFPLGVELLLPSLEDATCPAAYMKAIALRSVLVLVGARLEVSRTAWRPELVAALLYGQDWPCTAGQVQTAAASLGMAAELEEVRQALEAAQERGEVRRQDSPSGSPAWELARKPPAIA